MYPEKNDKDYKEPLQSSIKAGDTLTVSTELKQMFDHYQYLCANRKYEIGTEKLMNNLSASRAQCASIVNRVINDIASNVNVLEKKL